MDIKMRKVVFNKTTGIDQFGTPLKKGDKCIKVHYNNPNGRNITKLISTEANAVRGSRDFKTIYQNSIK